MSSSIQTLFAALENEGDVSDLEVLATKGKATIKHASEEDTEEDTEEVPLCNGKLAAANKERYQTLRLRLEELGIETKGSAQSSYNAATEFFRKSQSNTKLRIPGKSE